jgi:phosphatidylinositol alpha-1,6-mannosyltransferase
VPGLLRWARVARTVAEEPPGAAFVWVGNVKPAGYVARWLRARAGIPYGLMVHGLDLGLLREQTRRSVRKRVLAQTIIANAAGTVANSHWTAERFRALATELDLPGAASRIRVIPLAADPTRFCPAGSRYDLGTGRWLLTVARLVPHKGVDTAIAALATLLPRLPDLSYAVAGDGPDRQRLGRLAEHLGVAGRVRFLGAVPEERLPALYRAADLYVGLSREEGAEAEGFGLALVEAQACGVPVVAGRSGGIPDSVQDGVSGILVPPGDALGAARSIDDLLRDPGRRAAMGGAGRRGVEERLNWERVVRELGLAAEAFRAG